MRLHLNRWLLHSIVSGQRLGHRPTVGSPCAAAAAAATTTRSMARNTGDTIDKDPPSNDRQIDKKNPELVERMHHRFQTEAVTGHLLTHQRQIWDSFWESGTTPWDLQTATPALLSELKRFLVWNSKATHPLRPTKSSSTSRQTVFRTLVPGCGSGYDLLAIAHHLETEHNSMAAPDMVDATPPGPQPGVVVVVVGLDISEASLTKRTSVVMEASLRKRPLSAATTRIELALGDFFTKDQEWNMVQSFGGDVVTTDPIRRHDFDFIFDYTFFCALPPSLREAWGAKMASLLVRDTGRLLTIMFPIVDASDSARVGEGPPYPVSIQEYRKVLEPHGVYILEEHGGPRKSPDTVPARAGKELVCWWSRPSEQVEPMGSKL